MKKPLAVIAALCLSNMLFAQDWYNPLSVRPVHTSDIMYQKTVTRAMDLREKQNEPFFSRNREITALLMDGVTNGIVKAYENDSLRTQISASGFLKKLTGPNAISTQDTIDLFLEYGAEWKQIVAAIPVDQYAARDLYQLEIKECVLFDKQRSTLYYDIQTITVCIPADHPMNTKGIQIPVASFSYKEVAEKLFQDNPRAIWYNAQNARENKNLADAFDLRLFSSYSIKVSNSKDAYLTDIYSDQKKAIMASSWAASTIMEYEHNLWEF